MSGLASESVAPIPEERSITHAIARISDALRGLRYGSVNVVVQDGVVVQVERTEKLRLRQKESAQ